MMRASPQAKSPRARLATAVASETAAAWAIFVIALLPRILSLNAFITWDEPMWVYRSVQFLTALLQGNPLGTFQVGHPGVLTMICGSLGIAVQRFALGQGAAELEWLGALPALEPTDVDAMRRLALFLPASKLPLALMHALVVLLLYRLARRLVGSRAAFLGALLVALDPFHLALSRVLHIDAGAAGLMLCSLLTLLVHLRERSRRCLFLSGVLFGLAVLSKSYALLLAPLAGLVLFWAARTERRSPRDLLLHLALWGGSAALAFAVLWPAVWAAPFATVRAVLDTALGYSATPEATSSFFLGSVVEDPGLFFYPTVLAFRTTPLAWLGLLALLGFAVLAWRRREHARALQGRAVWILVAYACGFAVVMALAAKKFDRYMLPVILTLDLLAGVGLALCLQRQRRSTATWLLIGATALQGAFVLSHHPYYLAFYNPMAGGSRLAPSVLPLGWGEGMDLAARYLSQKEDAPELAIATAGIPGFAALFPGTVEPFTEQGLAVSDYALAYVAQVQQQAPLLERFAGLEPEHVVQIRGMDYVWIYRNEDHAELAAHLHAHMGPGDAILLDTPSPLQRTFPSARVLFDVPSETHVRQALGGIAADHEWLWYLHYPAREPQGWINDALSTRALLWSRASVGAVSLSRYALPSPGAFQRAEQDIALDVDFGGQLRLLGCQLSSDTVEYRQHVGVTLRWEALSQPSANYAVSLRLSDAEGHDWARDDWWILGGYGAATSAWPPGERGEQRHLLAIPPGIPPGHYKLRALVYDTDSLQALSVSQPGGASEALEPALATVQVAAPTYPAAPSDLSIPHLLDQEFAGVLAFLGYGLGTDTVAPGAVLEVSTFWQALAPMQQDYTLELALEDDSGQEWSQATFALPNDSHPTHLWKPREVLHARSDWPLAAELATGSYRLMLHVLHNGGQRLADTRLDLASLEVRGREHQFTAPEPGYEMQAYLGDRIALFGYDLAETSVPAGGTLHLILHWEALSSLEQSYAVFAHLLDQENRIWGQWDSVPCSGECPTTGWLEGEFIADAFAIQVAADAPPGPYHIAVGLYDPVTMDRLTAMDDQGTRWPEDRIELGTAIAVRPAE